ncbi:MAG: cytochrome c peroxidase [Lentilitoribacter sp.]
MRHAFSFLLLALFILGTSIVKAEILLNEDEIEQALLHGPWPPEFDVDPSNKVSGNLDAIKLGDALFADPILSKNGEMSCQSCHDPTTGFSDALPRAVGKKILDRNTPSLMNLRSHHWFGWTGGSDNIWAQSIDPILNADEMGHDRNSLKEAITSSSYLSAYDDLFGPIAQHDGNKVLVNISKALAAYQETLVTGQTSFDRFRNALEAGEFKAASKYPASAQRGLKLFLGRGNCAFCHSGPAFTNGEFHDAGVPYFISETRVDEGRYGGLKALKQSPYTLAGEFSDDPAKSGAWAVNQVRFQHSDFGTFRVTGLRGALHSAPYMHNGSLSDLAAVVDHYDMINMERLHVDGEAILQPLGLSDREKEDLVTFLKSLSDDLK